MILIRDCAVASIANSDFASDCEAMEFGSRL